MLFHRFWNFKFLFCTFRNTNANINPQFFTNAFLRTPILKMNYLRNIFLNKSMHCRIYESLKVLGIRIRPLELYLRTPFRTSFFSLRDVILNHRISAYYNTKSKVEKLWRAFRRRRSKIIITHFRITSNYTENIVKLFYRIQHNSTYKSAVNYKKEKCSFKKVAWILNSIKNTI